MRVFPSLVLQTLVGRAFAGALRLWGLVGLGVALAQPLSSGGVAQAQTITRDFSVCLGRRRTCM